MLYWCSWSNTSVFLTEDHRFESGIQYKPKLMIMEEKMIGAKAAKNEAISNLQAELRKLTQRMFNEKGEPIYFISRADTVGTEMHLVVHYSTLKNKKIVLFKAMYDQSKDPSAQKYPYSDDLVWTELYRQMQDEVQKYDVAKDFDNIVETYKNE